MDRCAYLFLCECLCSLQGPLQFLLLQLLLLLFLFLSQPFEGSKKRRLELDRYTNMLLTHSLSNSVRPLERRDLDIDDAGF